MYGNMPLFCLAAFYKFGVKNSEGLNIAALRQTLKNNNIHVGRKINNSVFKSIEFTGGNENDKDTTNNDKDIDGLRKVQRIMSWLNVRY